MKNGIELTFVAQLFCELADHVHKVLHKKGYFQFLTLESKL